MRRTLALLLLLLPLGLQAAEAPADETTADEAAAPDSEQAGPDVAAEQSPADVAATDEADATDEDTPPARTGDNDDFVPSVRISEDLSVSFPTDI